jgi:hypothetical protein
MLLFILLIASSLILFFRCFLFLCLLGDNIDTIQKSRETLNDASKEVCLEIYVEKTKYMLLFHHHNVVQNRDIRIANRSFEMCHISDIWGQK